MSWGTKCGYGKHHLKMYSIVFSLSIGTSDYLPTRKYEALSKAIQWGARSLALNPSTPVSDQDRITPYYIYTISCRQVMRMKKNVN